MGKLKQKTMATNVYLDMAAVTRSTLAIVRNTDLPSIDEDESFGNALRHSLLWQAEHIAELEALDIDEPPRDRVG